MSQPLTQDDLTKLNVCNDFIKAVGGNGQTVYEQLFTAEMKKSAFINMLFNFSVAGREVASEFLVFFIMVPMLIVLISYASQGELLPDSFMKYVGMSFIIKTGLSLFSSAYLCYLSYSNSILEDATNPESINLFYFQPVYLLFIEFFAIILLSMLYRNAKTDSNVIPSTIKMTTVVDGLSIMQVGALAFVCLAAERNSGIFLSYLQPTILIFISMFVLYSGIFIHSFIACKRRHYSESSKVNDLIYRVENLICANEDKST